MAGEVEYLSGLFTVDHPGNAVFACEHGETGGITVEMQIRV